MSTIINKKSITIEAIILAPVEKVWEFWVTPLHIVSWNHASDDWHTLKAENDLRVSGTFYSRMEAKDGSSGFDFTGRYTKIVQNKQICYTMDDGRHVLVNFIRQGNKTKVIEIFEPEKTHSEELQRAGWQAILNNFKHYAESLKFPEKMHFEIEIDADKGKVYETMLGKNTYDEWTSLFNPTSYYDGAWEKGSVIKFLCIDSDWGTGGTVAIIKENIKHSFVSIEHLHVVQNGKEITSGPEVKPWAGALENYTFIDKNGKTGLIVDLETQHGLSDEYKSYFLKTWPRALQKLKEICEK